MSSLSMVPPAIALGGGLPRLELDVEAHALERVRRHEEAQHVPRQRVVGGVRHELHARDGA